MSQNCFRQCAYKEAGTMHSNVFFNYYYHSALVCRTCVCVALTVYVVVVAFS
jgi:hypothetical protein